MMMLMSIMQRQQLYLDGPNLYIIYMVIIILFFGSHQYLKQDIIFCKQRKYIRSDENHTRENRKKIQKNIQKTIKAVRSLFFLCET